MYSVNARLCRALVVGAEVTFIISGRTLDTILFHSSGPHRLYICIRMNSLGLDMIQVRAKKKKKKTTLDGLVTQRRNSPAATPARHCSRPWRVGDHVEHNSPHSYRFLNLHNPGVTTHPCARGHIE